MLTKDQQFNREHLWYQMIIIKSIPLVEMIPIVEIISIVEMIPIVEMKPNSGNTINTIIL